MTTHELARQLLALDDVPIVHLHTVGINLLEENGVLVEVELYPEKLLREEGALGNIYHAEENCD